MGRIETALTPPCFSFSSRVAGVLDADELALPAFESDHVVDAQATWCVFVGVTFAMDAIDDVLDVVLGVGHFARQYSCLRCLCIMSFSLGWREGMTALGTVGITTCDQGVTFLAFFCRWALVRPFGFVLRFDLVDRSVAFNVAAKVEDEAILFVGV